jgi:hypothetical protein
VEKRKNQDENGKRKEKPVVNIIFSLTIYYMDKLGTKFDTITSKNGIKYDLFRLDKDTGVDKYLEGKKFKWNDNVIHSAWNKLGEEVMRMMKAQVPDSKITEKNYQQWVDVVEDVFKEYKCDPNVKDALCNYIDKKPILIPNYQFSDDNDEHQYIKIQHAKSKDNPLLNAKKRLTEREKRLDMLKKMGITPPPPQAPVEKKPSVLELDLKEFWEKLQSKGKRKDFTYGEMIELVKTYDSLVSKHGNFEDFHTYDKVYSQLLVDTGRARDTVKHNKKRGKQILDTITEIKKRMEDIEWMHAFINDKKNAKFYYKTMGRFKEGKGGKIHYYQDEPDDSESNKNLVDREWSQRMRADIKILKMALDADIELIKYNLNLTNDPGNKEKLHEKRPPKFVPPAKKKAPSKQVVLGDGSGAMSVGATSQAKPSSDYEPDELLKYGWKKLEHPKHQGKYVYSKNIKIWAHDKNSVLKYLEVERAKKKGGKKSRRKRKKKTRKKKGGKRKKTKKRKMRKKKKTRR